MTCVILCYPMSDLDYPMLSNVWLVLSYVQNHSHCVRERQWPKHAAVPLIRVKQKLSYLTNNSTGSLAQWHSLYLWSRSRPCPDIRPMGVSSSSFAVSWHLVSAPWLRRPCSRLNGRPAGCDKPGWAAAAALFSPGLGVSLPTNQNSEFSWLSSAVCNFSFPPPFF